MLIKLVLTLTPPFDIKHAEYLFEILTDSHESEIKPISDVEPQEYSDFYNSKNKHGILFKEIIYFKNITYCTIVIELLKLKKKKDSFETSNISNSKIANKISEDSFLTTKLQEKNKKTHFQEKPLCEIFEELEVPNKLRLIVEIYNDKNEIIYKGDFYNSTTIFNLILESPSKDEKQNKNILFNNFYPYFIICYFDSETNFQDDSLKHLAWSIRVFASNNIFFIKNTIQEEREHELKASWEKREPGRAQKAIQSRAKYLKIKETPISNQNSISMSSNDNLINHHIPLPHVLKSHHNLKDIYQPQQKEIKSKSNFIKSFMNYVSSERVKKVENGIYDYKYIAKEEQLEIKYCDVNKKTVNMNHED